MKKLLTSLAVILLLGSCADKNVDTWEYHSIQFNQYMDSFSRYTNIRVLTGNPCATERINYYSKKADEEYALAYPSGNPAFREKEEMKLDTTCYPIKDLK